MYLKKGTLIRANNSLIPIEEVEEGMKVQSFLPAHRLFYHGVISSKERVEDVSFLCLRAGKRELKASPKTVLPTSKSDGYIWKKLKDYQPGQLMLIQNLSSSVTFHEPIISIEDEGIGTGYRIHLKKYDNFVAEGFPVHTKPLPHPKEILFDF